MTKNRIGIFLGLAIALVVILPHTTFAAVGDITINVKQELSANLVGATVAIQCIGGTYTNMTGTTDASGNISVVSASVPAGANCGNTEGIDIQVTLDGYVTKTLASTTSSYTYLTGSANSYNVTAVQFGNKVTGVADELTNALATVTVTTGDSFGTTCTESSGAWYCAVPLANTALVIKAAKDGYVTNSSLSFTTDRTAATDAQQTKAVTGVLFAYKVTGVASEISGALTTVTVKSGDAAGTTCTESAGAWYCAVPLADTTLTISAAKDGYVTNTGNSFTTDRTAATDAQGTKAVTGVLFGNKVTGVADELGNALTTVTVKGGTAFGTTCTESAGAWYCAIPLANTATAISAAKPGYVTNTGISFTADRTAATDAQQTKAVTATLFALKVVLSDELGSALSSATVTHNGVAPDQTSTNSYYFTTVLAGAIAVAKTNYVSFSTAADTGLASVSTSTSAQTVINLTGTTAYAGSDPTGTTVTGSGLKFPLKVTVTKASDATALSGGTVTAGNSLSTSCTENSTTGIFYCLVPLTDTENIVEVEKSGYGPRAKVSTDRTAATDAQQTLAVTLVLNGVPGGHSSGGGGGATVVKVPGAPAVVTLPTQAAKEAAKLAMIKSITAQIQVLQTLLQRLLLRQSHSPR